MTPSPVRHGRDDVIDAALDVLSARGIQGLSMRAIADALHLQVSALYWHVPNKQTLLAAVSARILAHADARIDPDDVADPAAIAVGFRDGLLAFRDGAEVVSSSYALGLVDPLARERIYAAVRASGASAETAQAAADALVHFVIGFVFHEQQRRTADAIGVAAPDVALDPTSIGGTEVDPFRSALDFILRGIPAARAGQGRSSMR